MSHSNKSYIPLLGHVHILCNMTEPLSTDMQMKNSSYKVLNVGFDHRKEAFCGHLRMFLPVIGAPR